MKSIWLEIRDHKIKGERLFIQAICGQNNGMYRLDMYSETKRTNQQNKYMHVLFTLLQRALYDMGYDNITTKEKAKTFIKELFLTYEAENSMTKEKYKVTRGTSELSKDEGIEFIDKVIKFASEELGFYIPTAEEFSANPVKWSLSALAC